MSPSFRPSRATQPAPLSFVSVSALLVALLNAPAQAQQGVTVSPFLAYPAAATSPLLGLGVGISASIIGVRASAYVPISSGSSAAATPSGAAQSRSSMWGADADALLALGRSSPGGLLTPYVFAGVSAASDTGALVPGWSYGGGLALRLAGPLQAFAESRERMSRLVLPTAYGAPTPRMEFRAGLTLHLGWMSRSGSRSGGVAIIPAGEPAGGSTSNGTAARVLPTAEHYLGVPYRYGGTSPSTGFDCSGFTQFVFARHGVRLPRTAHEQAEVGMRMPADWRVLSAGDLVMFDEGGRIGHVAIYAGNGRIIHASSSGHGVRYDDLSTQRGQWFREHMVAARRVTPDSRGLMLDLARGFADGVGIVLDGPDHAPAPR